MGALLGLAMVSVAAAWQEHARHLPVHIRTSKTYAERAHANLRQGRCSVAYRSLVRAHRELGGAIVEQASAFPSGAEGEHPAQVPEVLELRRHIADLDDAFIHGCLS